MKKDPDIKKTWNFRVTQPAIVLAQLNLETLPEKLSCGCSCFDCRSNYQAYWNEHSYAVELKKALQAEKDFMNETIEDIKDMERDHKKEIHDHLITLEVERDKSRKLQEQLDFEMKIRMEESHKRHLVEEDIKLTLEEKKTLNKTLYDASVELYALRAENDAMKRNVNDAYVARERVINQIKEYEQQISQYEAINGDLRSRLYDHEIENAKLKRKNDILKEELKKPINMIAMPIRKGTSSMMPSTASNSNSNNNTNTRISSSAKSNIRDNYNTNTNNSDNDDYSITRSNKKKLPNLNDNSTIFSRNSISNMSSLTKLSKLSAALQGNSQGFY